MWNLVFLSPTFKNLIKLSSRERNIIELSKRIKSYVFYDNSYIIDTYATDHLIGFKNIALAAGNFTGNLYLI